VFSCTHKRSGAVLATKMVPTNQRGFKLADLLEETRLQRMCAEGHAGIVQIVEVFKERKAVHLVQELV
jgi:hypothetical protein